MIESSVRAVRSRSLLKVASAAALALLLGVSGAAVGGPGALQIDVLQGTTKADPNLPKTSKSAASETPNPYISWLPEEAKPDMESWQQQIHETALERRFAAEAQAAGGAAKPGITSLIGYSETEASGTLGINDLGGNAEFIAGFGTGAGDDGEADVSGEFAPESAAVAITPNAEDEGDIPAATLVAIMDRQKKIAAGFIGDGPYANAPVTPTTFTLAGEDDDTLATATVTGVVVGEQASADATIGDGSYGTGGVGADVGDFDFYAFDVTSAQTVIVQANQRGVSTLDPILAIYDSAGSLVAFNDDANSGTVESQIVISLSCTPEPSCYPQTFYAAVGGYRDGAFLPTDPTSTGTGPGIGSEGDYEIVVTMPEFRSGDFDFYRVDALQGDLLQIEVDTSGYGGVLDPILAVYDAAGNILFLNDDDFTGPSLTFDSYLRFRAPANGAYYIAVGGFNPFASPTSPLSFLIDPFDSSTGLGPGIGSEGSYDLIISKNDVDLDYFSFDLEQGDIIATNLDGFFWEHGPIALIEDPSGNLLIGSDVDHAGNLPASSPLPGGGRVSSAYVVNQAGRYTVGVGFGFGAYTLELRAFRPPQEATGTKQRVFLDFDGATIDTSRWGVGVPQPRVLSPLSSFLGGWGLTGADEDAVIDSIVAVVEEKLRAEISANGANPAFDVEILNSRDHPDLTGDPDISTVIIGGTQAESGIATIGIAESIDIGNFDMTEDSLVLLDLLSASASNPNSLNSFGLTGGATIIDLIGEGVGNIAAHEAGHFFANYHTDNANTTPNIMDQGGNLGNLVGVGTDGIFGSGDDVNVTFGLDVYTPNESFEGIEDTRNSIAFDLTASPNASITTLPDISGDGVPDLASFVGPGTGKPFVNVISGADGTLIRTIGFVNDDWEGIAIDTISDSNSDGTADDPGIALLARSKVTGSMLVHLRRASDGVTVKKINFLNPDWTPVDIVAINDTDGDGNPNDASIGVLAEDESRGKILMQVRTLATGAKIANRSFLNAAWRPVAASVVLRSGMTPLVGVLGLDNGSLKTLLQTRQLSNGVLQRNTRFFNGADWHPIDVALIQDGNSDGTADDPAWLVLAKNKVTEKPLIQARLVSSAVKMKNMNFLTTDYIPLGLATSGDISGNGFEEVLVLARRPANDQIIIQIRDYLTGARTANVFP